MAKADGPMVVMMTGYGSVESAVSCMQMGAFDYVVKPFSFEQIEVVVDKVASFDKIAESQNTMLRKVTPVPRTL